MDKKYSNEEITIIWQPEACTHSRMCWSQLSEVFDPRKRPWIDINGAENQRIIEQVKQCPSGALSFYYNNTMQEEIIPEEVKRAIVELRPNGPIVVHGPVEIRDNEGNVIELRDTKVSSFCRCGQSQKLPFCDGSHKQLVVE
jgi:uncharacterized Fe-S cluster protein YjdI